MAGMLERRHSMRFLAVFILSAVLFVSVGLAEPVRAQIYQPPPPALTPVTGPNCPQVSGLPTAPAVHLYGVCTYNGGRANVTVPAGLVLRWRYYVPVWWWPPYQQEITAFAYPGQTVTTDWFEVFYATYLAYTPVPVYPPVPVPAPPYPSPPYTPPPYTPPAPGLPSPGTPAPPRTETGVGLSLGFAQGWPVAGYRLQYVSGRIVWQCHTFSAPEAGWVTDGVISPNAGDIARAPTPCP